MQPDARDATQSDHPHPHERERHARWPLMLAAAALAGGLGLMVLPYRLDDAFIAFRYADHFASGHGIAFNRGGPAVEGFSSPLWFLGLSAVSAVLGRDALPWAATLAGYISLLACLSVAVRAGPAERWSRVLLLLLLASSAPAVYYAVTGLETVAFLLVALLYISAALGRVPLGLGIAAGLAASWLRPEGAWLIVCHAAALLAAREPPSRRDVALAAALLAGSASLLAVRLLVFGELMPNTYYAKTPDLALGARYVWDVVRSPWAAGVIVLCALGAVFGSRSERGLAAAALAWLGAAWLEGGDWMPVGRFALPALGLAVVASADALAESRSRAQLGMVLAAGALTIAANVAELRQLATLARSDLESVVHEQRVLAQWLQSSGARSVALVDIGEVGFRTTLDVIDLAGLTDARIARAPGTHLRKAGVTDYVLAERRPDVVVLRVNGAQPRDDERVLREVPRFALEPVEREIARSPILRDAYRLVFALLPADMRTPFYGRVLFVRRELRLSRASDPNRRIVYLRPLRL